MILQHLRYDLREYVDEGAQIDEELLSQPILLLDDNDDVDERRVLAQLISFDIRGNYGQFLNGNIVTEWRGNIFELSIKNSDKDDIPGKDGRVVKIHNYVDEDVDVTLSYEDWIEALEDWKCFYLEELGFLSFKDSAALNHLFGVFLLGNDLKGKYDCDAEVLCEAIKMCAERFGVSISDIYRDCRKITGFYSIEDFYIWASAILNHGSCEKCVFDFAARNIRHEKNVKQVFKERLNIDLY